MVARAAGGILGFRATDAFHRVCLVACLSGHSHGTAIPIAHKTWGIRNNHLLGRVRLLKRYLS